MIFIIKSVHKAALLLKLLSDCYPDGMRFDDICRKSGIGKSTCVHILDTLIEDQLAERMSYATYRLAAGCFLLTRFGKFDETRLSVCRPVLNRLHKECGKTVLIAEIQNCRKYTVDYIEADMKLHNSSADIIEDSIYKTATGRLIMSHMSKEDVAEIVYKNGLPNENEWRRFECLLDFENELCELRKKQFISVSNLYEGVYYNGVAAEIHDNNGIVGALGVAYKSEKPFAEADPECEKIAGSILRASKEMSRRLCFDNK